MKKDINKLHDYQTTCRDKIIGHQFYGLFFDCGMGKTITVLAALDKMMKHPKIPWKWHTLVIAPKTIAKSTWINEIKEWDLNIPYKSLILNEKGKQLSKKKRLELYKEIPSMPPTMFFINRDLMVDLVENCTPWPFQFVIIDESQSFKSTSSKRYAALKSVRNKICKMVELSGTPAPKDLLDIHGQVSLMDGGRRLGRTKTEFRRRYYTPNMHILSPSGRPFLYTLNRGAEKEIYRLISDCVSSIKNTRIILPPIHFNDIYVTMDDDEVNIYKTMAEKAVLHFQTENGKDGKIEAKNQANLALVLWQMASGTVYYPEEKDEDGLPIPRDTIKFKIGNQTEIINDFSVIHEKKLDVLEHILDTTSDNVLILYNFRSDLKQIVDRLTDMKYVLYGTEKPGQKTFAVFDKSPEMQDAWNKKEISALILQPQSSGHGINIQNGSHTIVWYTLPLSLEYYIQANARLHRQGQTETVIIHRILTKDTLDEHIMSKTLYNKEMALNDLLDAVQLKI